MKKILLIPVRNEAWILEQTLAAASLWADHIIVANHGSTDQTANILRRYPKVLVITNSHPFHTSTIRKELLEAARNFEGNNALFSFDADELPTGHVLNDTFWSEIERLPTGTSIQMEWVNLWRLATQYRIDGVQAPQWKVFGYIDDRKMDYDTLGVINDHTSRVPMAALRNSRRFDFPKVLHYQFVDWRRLLSKQAHYRMVEWLQKKQSMWTAFSINLKYFSTKDERGLKVAFVPPEWLKLYSDHGVTLGYKSQVDLSWHDSAVLGYFEKYGKQYFDWLDIWDIDWPKSASVRPPKTVLIEESFHPSFIGGLLRALVKFAAYKNWLLRLHKAVSNLLERKFV
jgi:glycosyltransferase involved in cell wall biosynthesis